MTELLVLIIFVEHSMTVPEEEGLDFEEPVQLLCDQSLLAVATVYCHHSIVS